MLKKGIIVVYCLLIASAVLQAQGGITVKTSADKNKIVIGEQLQLTIEINVPAGASVNLPLTDSMLHFEVVGKPVTDTVEGNTITTIKSVYAITSFDSGSWAIPSFSIASGIQTDSIPVEVVFSEFDPKQPYHDITDVEDVPVKKQSTPWWWYAAGVLVIILILIFFLRKKKPAAVPVIAPEKKVDPYREAMRQLEELAAVSTVQKEYYSALTDIFRLYIFRRKGILSLHKTTDDLVVQLKTLDMDKEVFDSLSQALRMGDFVKFAKYNPDATADKKSMHDIRQAIMHIEQKEQNQASYSKNKHS